MAIKSEEKRPKTAAKPMNAEIPARETLIARHIGPNLEETAAMLKALGYASLDALIDAALPPSIKTSKPLSLGRALSEGETLKKLAGYASKNQIFRSYLGMGYNGTVTPSVILRNVLENPGWYTAYTPYQAEIAQGRLEMLLNFQTMIEDLTGLPVANASLLDEATAAAEAMCLSFAAHGGDSHLYYVSKDCHPQTIDVVLVRAKPLGITVQVLDEKEFNFGQKPFGVLIQYPKTTGEITDYGPFCKKAHEAGAQVTVAADLLALTLLKSPGELGAEIAVGSTQRFGGPLGYGGPHAAYMSVKDELKRLLPGRIVGTSKDAPGRPAYRLALQTREQHVRREKATSNICTAQVLPAVLAASYGVYHGPEGLAAIARRVHALAWSLSSNLKSLGFAISEEPFFDTVLVQIPKAQMEKIKARALERRINFRYLSGAVVIALDETVEESDLKDILEVFAAKALPNPEPGTRNSELSRADPFPGALARKTRFMTHPIFHSHRSETEFMRYLKRLESKDVTLTQSMIPLGSCTMKLNAASEMKPLSWPGLSDLHPFAPLDQTKGYQELFKELESWLCDLTGYAAFSLQPNAGSQGEYAGLLSIRAYHESHGDAHRTICLIPESAHGTNPASAARAGFTTVTIKTVPGGDIDLADLKAKAKEHAKDLGALMVTYPSTHGIFEETIKEVCAVVHAHGGLVYLDGANMNALVGLCRVAELGADIGHLNLHKTFCIPHGGGGPGMGPVGAVKALAPFLPRVPFPVASDKDAKSSAIGPISAAPWGSPLILPISWSYLAQMGGDGLIQATKIAILNANYIAKRLAGHYPVLFKGRSGLVAHECIIDIRPIKEACGVTAEDLAKRLIDYGFHAPTVSWPVTNTLMIEPTESESQEEIDRFCDAMISIRAEIKAIEDGKADKANNLLKNAPHTAEMVSSDHWDKPYSREAAAYPAPWLKDRKYWPPVARIDNVYGDRNLVCACS